MTRNNGTGRRSRRRTLALIVATALVATVGGTGRVQAAGGTYRVTAGGDQNWGPGSGATDQTSDDKLIAAGTLTGDSQGHSVGNVGYEIASGPGITRAKLAGSFTIPSGLAYPFNPSLQAVSTTELTVSGPAGFVNTSVNVHVDGIIEAPICGGLPSCGAENVQIQVGPFYRVSEFDTLPETRSNQLGLAFDPVPGGFRVHGDVTSAPLGVQTNTPYPVTIVLNISGRYAGSPAPTTLAGNFDDPAAAYQVSFSPSGPVLNDIPPGYTVSGPSVTDNHWTDPFGLAPPPDTTSPTVAGVPDRQPNVFGWYRTPVTIDWQAKDDLGQASDPPDTVVATDGTDIVSTSDPSCDPSGNCATGTFTLSLDQVPPAVTCREAPVYQLTPSSIAFLDAFQSDSLSGAAATTPGVGIDVSSAGAKTAQVVGEDFAGNTTVVPCPYVVVDSTHPTVAGVPDRQPNVFGWYRTPVTIDWQAKDDSGQASDPPDTVVATDGTDIVSTSDPSCDPSGNCATGTFTLSLDQVPPAVTCREAPVYQLTPSSIAFLDAFQSDSLSGAAATTPGVGIDVSSAGAKTAQVVGEDFAGNTTVVPCPYVVVDSQPDTTPPVVTVPGDTTVDATTPTGAVVSYAASAVDDRDPAPAVTCAPASGSTFPVGTTPVSCVATDVAGNAATATFVVRVRGAGDQAGG